MPLVEHDKLIAPCVEEKWSSFLFTRVSSGGAIFTSWMRASMHVLKISPCLLYPTAMQRASDKSKSKTNPRLRQVRVYQAHNDSSHSLGCDTKDYPTRDFIKANHERYKSPDDEHVMLPVQHGGGSCRYETSIFVLGERGGGVRA